MTSRNYETISDWTLEQRREVETPRGIVAIIIEWADIRHLGDEHVYRSGRYRVRVDGPGKGWPRMKTWTGETAWSDAERHARDLEFDFLYANV